MHGKRLLVSLVLAVCTPALAQKAPRGAKAPATDPGADAVALAGTEPEAAAHAAERLGASGAPAAHDALLDALAMGLAPAVAVPALTALALHPAPPDVGALRRYAGHHTPAVRAASLGALAMYPDPSAQALVIAALHDPVGTVRSAAAAAAARGRVRGAVEPLMLLLARGEEPAARALAALADPDLARKVADQLGHVPDPSLALCLGLILRRADFGPDAARVEIVRAIGKIQDGAAITALTDYIDSVPKNPPRPSRHEAEMIVEARIGGGK